FPFRCEPVAREDRPIKRNAPGSLLKDIVRLRVRGAIKKPPADANGSIKIQSCQLFNFEFRAIKATCVQLQQNILTINHRGEYFVEKCLPILRCN
ncbi:hypothetical protein, partial [Kluyvera ascorbata]